MNLQSFISSLRSTYSSVVFLQEDFPHSAHHREIAISISNYTLKHGDAGLIIIGGRMEMQPHVCFSIVPVYYNSIYCLYQFIIPLFAWNMNRLE